MNQNAMLLHAVTNSAQAEMDGLRRRIDAQRDEALVTHLYTQLSEYRAIHYHAAEKLHAGGQISLPNLPGIRPKKRAWQRRPKSDSLLQTDLQQMLRQCPLAAGDVRELAYQLLRTQQGTAK